MLNRNGFSIAPHCLFSCFYFLDIQLRIEFDVQHGTTIAFPSWIVQSVAGLALFAQKLVHFALTYLIYDLPGIYLENSDFSPTEIHCRFTLHIVPNCQFHRCIRSWAYWCVN